MSRGTWEQNRVVLDFKYKTFTFFGDLFQGLLLSSTNPMFSVPQPPEKSGFRLLRFRSPLLTESRVRRGFFSSPY